ncbi:TIGR04500 family putative peptide maturation system protein [Planotetraspora sp. A-T 1434]|uniref:TIGR04500 family putative peptide maturation system protein n=1 Tax=Planotetraspora sp. A-T 1434 TaxID=2979219 RepID=UPI0021BEBB34|nr:TIGR04500 family putative peptide maturation system protein [Planotetraspora sp. A-T 1434]MCT9934257.1 TIGR04500 family putative peptide maturation system protein [Planotetraspora sp. A-T 1434]
MTSVTEAAAGAATDGVLGDALSWLRELDGTTPDEARKRLDGLRAAHPGVGMRLVWQREAATGDYHYDLLFPSPGGTVSLAFAPDRAIPWPLRGSQRSGEQLVLRVNGADVLIERAVSLLDALWDAGLAVRLVNACLVEEAVAAARVDPTGSLTGSLTDEELQRAMDAFRRARGLLTTRATQAWMAERGLGHARLEELVAAEAAVASLRGRVTAGRAESYFAEHRDAFDRLRVVRLRYADAAEAGNAAARLRDGEDAIALAAEAMLGGLATCRMEGNHREDLVTLHGEQAGEARAGAVLGPHRLDDGGSAVTCVLAVEPAALDEITRKVVEQRLFDSWLRDRRREAHVEWFWGSTARTDELTARLKA